MINDWNISERISDLIYKDMLGLADEEEKRELDSLLVTYKLKGLDREKIIARLQDREIFNGKEAYQTFRALKQLGGKSRRLTWWTSIVASVVVLVVTGWWFGRELELKGGNTQSVAETGQTERSRAVVTLADGQQVVLAQADRRIEECNGTILQSDSGALVYTTNVENMATRVMYNTVSIPRGGEYKLKFADGTKVWLNSETELRYPLVFDKEKRKVELLKGEAYFEVSRDEKRPFVVVTKEMTTRVLGTEFNVQSYAGKATNVTLVKGSVGVKANECEVKEVVLVPGENVSLEDGELVVEKVDVQYFTAWKEGYFYYNDVRLEDMLDELGEWFDFTAFYQTQALKDYRFKFWMNRQEHPRKVAERLNELGTLNVEWKDGCLIVSEKELKIN